MDNFDILNVPKAQGEKRKERKKTYALVKYDDSGASR